MKTKKRKSALSMKNMHVLQNDELLKIKGGTDDGTPKEGEFD